MADDYKFAQGPARLATDAEIAREVAPGHMTKPDLHRRIDNDLVEYATEDAYLLTEDGYCLLGEDNSDVPASVIIETELGDELETEEGDPIETDDGQAPTPASSFYLMGDIISDTSYPINYSLLVQGVNSYRNIHTIIHDEDSTTTEIP